MSLLLLCVCVCVRVLAYYSMAIYLCGIKIRFIKLIIIFMEIPNEINPLYGIWLCVCMSECVHCSLGHDHIHCTSTCTFSCSVSDDDCIKSIFP